MNIVYVTSLSKNKCAGPNTSVPKQIEAQSKVDNVFWYNVNNLLLGEMTGDVKCHCTDEYPTLKITDLPKPFNKPDLVVFEGLYFISFIKLSLNCRKNNIPYIIIPRSSLTDAGQRSKALKKKLGNVLLFDKFIKNAIGIQYLTGKEFYDSGTKWNRNNIVIPNGINKKYITKRNFNSDKLNGVFIGRLDIYQKGLDLLVNACGKMKRELRSNNCQIAIYGSSIKGSKIRLNKLIKNHGLSNMIFVKEAVYDDVKIGKLLDSDFFVLTSRFEGQPMGLLEALSYGLPSFVTNGVNMANEIETFGAGWTADISEESIADAIKKLLNSSNELKKKSQNAVELSKNYNWEDIAYTSHEKYKKLIGRL